MAKTSVNYNNDFHLWLNEDEEWNLSLDKRGNLTIGNYERGEVTIFFMGEGEKKIHNMKSFGKAMIAAWSAWLQELEESDEITIGHKLPEVTIQ